MNGALNIHGLAETLEATAIVLNRERVRWMVFGGAAMALHGIFDDSIKDIDIIVPGSAAATLSTRFSWPNYADDLSPRFRSDYLLRPDFGPIPVEVLGNFHIWDGRRWAVVEPRATLEMRLGSQPIYLPERDRLAGIFRLCGREKDLRRAALIDNS